jgi:hypothetical protein
MLGPGLISLVSSFLFLVPSPPCLVLSLLEQSKTTNPSSHASSIWSRLHLPCLIERNPVYRVEEGRPEPEHNKQSRTPPTLFLACFLHAYATTGKGTL